MPTKRSHRELGDTEYCYYSPCGYIVRDPGMLPTRPPASYPKDAFVAKSVEISFQKASRRRRYSPVNSTHPGSQAFTKTSLRRPGKERSGIEVVALKIREMGGGGNAKKHIGKGSLDFAPANAVLTSVISENGVVYLVTVAIGGEIEIFSMEAITQQVKGDPPGQTIGLPFGTICKGTNFTSVVTCLRAAISVPTPLEDYFDPNCSHAVTGSAQLLHGSDQKRFALIGVVTHSELPWKLDFTSSAQKLVK
ncbi:hypothetical protein BKA70DRAFT_1520284 [Coprinopsis sp. MPI-PUGE-AT-0042]|nr:hypothetical protein BKA70DRAFT_1520284 [Coprinopsis sp. MPI-PUGE-AT-0042]